MEVSDKVEDILTVQTFDTVVYLFPRFKCDMKLKIQLLNCSGAWCIVENNNSVKRKFP